MSKLVAERANPSPEDREQVMKAELRAQEVAADTWDCEKAGLRVRRKTLKPATPSVV